MIDRIAERIANWSSDHFPAVVLAILVAAALGVGASFAFAGGNDSTTNGCASGQWVHATVVKANGEKLSVDNQRQLPKGYSATTSSGDQKVTVHDDGSVEAEGGEVVVECVTPTH